jgi:hypothetical protein
MTDAAVDVLDVVPEEGIKLGGVLSLMIIAVPPEPVAPFCDHHFPDRFPRPVRLGVLVQVACQELARRREVVPGAILLRVTDPGSQVPVDPTAGQDRLERIARGLQV